MTINDPFSDPRIQGLIKLLCVKFKVTPEELILSVREAGRGTLDCDTPASPSSPATGDGEQE